MPGCHPAHSPLQLGPRLGVPRREICISLSETAPLARRYSVSIVNRQAARANEAYPPKGRFVTADGVRLHYIERGRGRPVVVLHGNGMMAEDALVSDLLTSIAANSYRAVAIDRPGFGHSDRPRGKAWTAAAQAGLLPEVFRKLGIDKPIVVGHSLGTMVALALALDHPDQVSGLVLASGYYYPTARADVALVSPPAVPILGDLLCHTVVPLVGEALAPRFIKKMFSPHHVPRRFLEEFPIELMFRPTQMSAASKDATHMIPDASRMSERYVALSCQLAILAGDADKVVDQRGQGRRLHQLVPGSYLDVFERTGHMTHYADPARVVRAIQRVSGAGQ